MCIALQFNAKFWVFIPPSFLDVLFFYYHMFFMVLRLGLSFDNSLDGLRLCFLILVAPRLTYPDCIVIFWVSWILLIIGCQGLPSLLSTNHLDLILIKGLHTKLWAPKVARVLAVGILGLPSPTWESWHKMTFGWWSRSQPHSIL
jgi:hypothetical protein